VSVVAVVASVALGLVFVVAGASKLAAGAAWHQQATDLGAPRWAIRVVPWLELVVGALLVVQVARRPLAGVALVLLLAFTALIVLRLREGRRPPCACFGAWSARPLGPGHVARNAVFVALAVVALAA
jgi:uncharacterized membrane protein YphA (DoxX/SURF4 family)